MKSIRSKSPAVLLLSGPGTGKTHTLASRVAYLLRENICQPQNMVLLSFSNRDAEILKEKAIDLVVDSSIEQTPAYSLTKEQLNERLWGGTIHKFAANIIQVYSSCNQALRVLSNDETKKRVYRCILELLDENRYTKEGLRGYQKLREARLLHRDALLEVRQSQEVMVHQVGRCFELWKESAMLPPPALNGIKIQRNSFRRSSQDVRDGCLTLATRLGVTPNVAYLAWSIFPLYQKLHEQHISGDPADLVPLAYNLLLTKPHQLSKLRTKLHHIILDEYQDISVAQHALIRLVVRGLVDELDYIAESQSNVPPVLASECKQCPLYNTSIIQVPNLFCAGDSEQSIYGFRGAAPQISVTGFRKDFPQGVIVHLDTSFRLPNRMWSTVNALVGDDGRTLSTETFPRSPVGDLRARSTVLETLDKCSSVHNVDLLSDLLADELSHALTETVHIQGVWDCREEAKHIATLIKRRAKERTRLLNHACSPLNPTQSSQISDPFEVAIIVRAGNQLDMIREALDNAGISYMDMNRQVKISARSMTGAKPVVLTTMHGSKGEEFDEVYLPGWSEGVFPHPSAVSTNRIEEERRLAYVAISRARYRVYITHAFVRRAMHVGKNLGQKMVTLQVRPSRFLYELVPNGAYSNTGQIDNSNTIENIEGAATIPTITWDRKRGSKGGIAGANLPGYFQKSYMAPRGFHSPDLPDHELLIMHRQLEVVMKMHTNHPHQKKRTKQRQRRQTSPFVLTPTMLTGLEFDSVLKMINDILAGKRGSCTKHKASFLQTLKSSFGFTRGKIILLPCEAEVKTLSRLDRLKVLGLFKELPGEGLLMRPLSQSTALQIGLFLLFSLQHHSSAQLAPAA